VSYRYYYYITAARINIYVKVYEKAKSLCEEFSNDVIFDHTRFSIIVNIEPQYLRIIKKELEKFNYTLVFSKYFKNSETITLCFTLN
jgi:hypothetical protein